jgi:hypothetical protein
MKKMLNLFPTEILLDYVLQKLLVNINDGKVIMWLVKNKDSIRRFNASFERVFSVHSKLKND